MRDCQRVHMAQTAAKRSKTRGRKGERCHEKQKKILEKCNKKIGRKRETKAVVKDIEQMSLVKRESKDKSGEGGVGNGGGGTWDGTEPG